MTATTLGLLDLEETIAGATFRALNRNPSGESCNPVAFPHWMDHSTVLTWRQITHLRLALRLCYFITLLIVIAALLLCRPAFAGPVVINTIYDLENIQSNLSGDFILGGNIDASATSNWNSGAGFSPIGDSSAPFTGTLDGNGHTIANLTVNDISGNAHAGLFGVVGDSPSSRAKITNLQLTNVHISGVGAAGAIAGSTFGGSIINVSASGTVAIANGAGSAGDAGGLVGYLRNTELINSDSFASVAGQHANSVGGLVGVNTSSEISGSHAFGTATNSESPGTVQNSGVGGLVGINAANGEIVQSSAVGSVTCGGTNTCGGLVGTNGGVIAKSYANENVVNTSHGLQYSAVGGLVGENVNTGMIGNAYASGAANGGNYVGGLVGQNDGTISSAYSSGPVAGDAKANTIGGLVGGDVGTNGVVTSGYWDNQTSMQSMGIGGAGVLSGATGLSTAQLQSGSLPVGFDSNIWTTTAGRYPSIIGNQATLSDSAPSIATLANLSLNAYYGNDGFTNKNLANQYYAYVGDNFATSLGGETYKGLRAVAYANPDDSQVVIAFRGSDGPILSPDCYQSLACAKNVGADTSFLTGVPTTNLEQEILNAVKFVNTIRALPQYRNARITLTGHSLGGAVAQILGYTSGYSAAAFDAPGSGELIDQLHGLGLESLAGATSGGNANTNYRMYCDIVSQAGKPLNGTLTLTIAAPGAIADCPNSTDQASITKNLQYFTKQHDPKTMASYLDAHDPPVIASNTGEPLFISTIKNVIQPDTMITTQSVSGDTRLWSAEFNFGFPLIDSLSVLLDPSGGTSFILNEAPGSSPFSAIDLPTEPGLAQYAINFRSNGVWAPVTMVDPGIWLDVPSSASDIFFAPFSKFGQMYTMPTDFLFGLTFAKPGNFTGTLTETEAAMPEPGTLSLVFISLGVLLWCLQGRRELFDSQ